MFHLSVVMMNTYNIFGIRKFAANHNYLQCAPATYLVISIDGSTIQILNHKNIYSVYNILAFKMPFFSFFHEFLAFPHALLLQFLDISLHPNSSGFQISETHGPEKNWETNIRFSIYCQVRMLNNLHCRKLKLWNYLCILQNICLSW